jgi:hypothetical protein
MREQTPKFEIEAPLSKKRCDQEMKFWFKSKTFTRHIVESFDEALKSFDRLNLKGKDLIIVHRTGQTSFL